MTPKYKHAIVGVVAVVAISVASYQLYSELRPAFPVSVQPKSVVEVPENLARDEPEDRITFDAFSGQSRAATILAPLAYSQIERDASGNVWLQGNGNGSSATFRRSVERAAAGQSHIVRDGHILIVDSSKRYWAIWSGHEDELLCYDGHIWLPPHKAAQGGIGFAKFLQTAMLDSSGNLVFLSTSSSGPGGFHRLTPDGKWEFWPFAGKEPGLTENPAIVEMPGGRLAYAPGGSPLGDYFSIDAVAMQERQLSGKPFVARKQLPPVYISDSQYAFIVQPIDLAPEMETVAQVIACPDGSVLTWRMDSQTGQFVRPVIQWPAVENNAVQQLVRNLIAILDDPDPVKRAETRTALLRLGPPISPDIDSALLDEQHLSPETKVALTGIQKILVRETNSEVPGDEALYGGRFKFPKDVSSVSRRLDGQIRLFASQCEDQQDNLTLGPSYITVGRDGVWSAIALADPSQSADASWIFHQNHIDVHEDVAGNLWMGQWSDRILTPDLHLLYANQPGDPRGVFTATDREGRVFLRSNDNSLIIYDRRVEALASGGFLIKSMPVNAVAAPPVGTTDISCWLCTANELTRIEPNGAQVPVRLPTGYAAKQCIPLRGNTVLAWLRTQTINPDVNACVFDGHNWVEIEEGNIRDSLTHVVPYVCAGLSQPVDCPLGLLRFGGDGGKGLWYEGYHSDDDGVLRYDLNYYDGAAWHDIWPMVIVKEPEPVAVIPPPAPMHTPMGYFNAVQDPAAKWQVLGNVDGGGTLLVEHMDTGHVFSVRFENSAINVHLVTGGLRPRCSPVYITRSLTGRNLLFTPGKTSTAISEYRDGQLVPYGPADAQGRFQLTDYAGRHWLADKKSATVIDGDHIAVAAVNVAGYQPRIIQGPDHRIWLVDDLGVSCLRYDGRTLSSAARLDWDGKKVNPLCWIDGSGKLWIDEGGGKVEQATLPPNI